MTKQEVRARIVELAIIPAVRASNDEDALFAAEAVSRGGIPIVELTMTVPNATELIAHLVKKHPHMVVGAGTVLDIATARACLAAGAKFITSPGLDLEVVEFAVKAGVIVIPGALTPSEIMAAVKAGADFVKIFPCSQVGGVDYLRALKISLPQCTVHRGRRRQSANSGAVLGCWSHCRRHWSELDPATVHHYARGGVD